jgi:hypothetical protein
VIHEDQCAGGNRHNIHIFIRVTVWNRKSKVHKFSLLSSTYAINIR